MLGKASLNLQGKLFNIEGWGYAAAAETCNNTRKRRRRRGGSTRASPGGAQGRSLAKGGWGWQRQLPLEAPSDSYHLWGLQDAPGT